MSADRAGVAPLSAASPDPDDLQRLRERLAGVGDPLSLLAGLFAFAPVGFQIYRADGHSLLTNAAFRRLFGSEPPPEYNVLRDEIAERTGVLHLIHRAFAGETVHLPAVWYDPRELTQVQVTEANRVAIESTFFPLRDASGRVGHVAIVFKDVTAETAARERAEAERDRLALAQEAGHVGTWEWDLATDQAVWSAEMEALYGLPPGGFGGGFEHWRQAVHPEDRERAERAVREAAAQGADLDVEFRVVRPDGSVRHMAAKARVLRDPGGGRRRMIGVNVDVTDLRQALVAAEEALRARDEFLSIASHELKTPVSGIKGYAQLLARRVARGRVEPTAMEQPLRALVQAADRLAQLTEDLLDVSRLRLGQLQLRSQRVELAGLVEEAVGRYRGDGEHAIALAVPPGPCELDADPDRLVQVVANLLENALKYSPGGEPIQVTLRLAEGGYLLNVCDQGIGLPLGTEERIFEPFGRAPNAAARNIPGMGLGLYICRQIVQAHGGRIRAESPGEGQGTTISVWLPRAADVQ